MGFTIVRNSSQDQLQAELDKMNISDKSITIPMTKKKHHIKINALGFRNL